jgi:hypothetical protein
MVEDLYTVDDDGSLVLAVQAQPGAGRSVIVGRHGDAVKVKVAAPPEHGKANDAIAEMLAQHLGLKAAQVELVAGASSRTKRFRISGVEEEEVAAALGRLLAPGAPGNAGNRSNVRDRRSERRR